MNKNSWLFARLLSRDCLRSFYPSKNYILRKFDEIYIFDKLLSCLSRCDIIFEKNHYHFSLFFIFEQGTNYYRASVYLENIKKVPFNTIGLLDLKVSVETIKKLPFSPKSFNCQRQYIRAQSSRKLKIVKSFNINEISINNIILCDRNVLCSPNYNPFIYNILYIIPWQARSFF